MTNARDPGVVAAAAARAALADATRPLSAAAAEFRRLIPASLEEEDRAAIERLIGGDPDAKERGRQSIASIETTLQTAQRNLAIANDSVSQARWRLELRSAESALTERRAALTALAESAE